MSAASRAPRKAGSAPVFGLMRAASPGVSVNDRPSSPSAAGPSSQNANLAAVSWAAAPRAVPAPAALEAMGEAR